MSGTVLDAQTDLDAPKDWPLPIVSIEKIEVEGNKGTDSREVIRLSDLEVGQELSRERIILAKQALQTSGLFSSVEIKVNLVGKTKSEILITVKEKTTWFAVPFFQYSKGSMGGGGAFGETNLFGRSKKYMVGGMWSNSARSGILGYRDPSFWGTRMIIGLDGVFRSETLEEYYNENTVAREVYLREMGATLLPGIQWTPHFSTSIGAFFRQVKQNLKVQTSLARALSEGGIRDGRDVAGVIRFDFKKINSFEGIDEGMTTEFEAHLSDDRFKSEYDYSRQIFRLTMAQRIGRNTSLFGFKSLATVQFGQRLPFYREFTAGGLNLRGYRDRQFRGDTRYSFTEEVLIPIVRFRRFILRGDVFWDSTVLYFKSEDFKRRNWRNGVGGGLRLFLTGINFPAIGYDVGYGIEDQSVSQYLNIGVAF